MPASHGRTCFTELIAEYLTGGDVRPRRQQVPERRVPAVYLWQVKGRMGQASWLGGQTPCLLEECSVAYSNSPALVSDFVHGAFRVICFQTYGPSVKR